MYLSLWPTNSSVYNAGKFNILAGSGFPKSQFIGVVLYKQTNALYEQDEKERFSFRGKESSYLMTKLHQY